MTNIYHIFKLLSFIFSVSCKDGYFTYNYTNTQICLKYVSTLSTYPEATKYCQADGGDLIKLDSQLKHDIVTDYLGKYWWDRFSQTRHILLVSYISISSMFSSYSQGFYNWCVDPRKKSGERVVLPWRIQDAARLWCNMSTRFGQQRKWNTSSNARFQHIFLQGHEANLWV